MNPTTTATLIDALRRHRVLPVEQIQKVEALRARFPDPRLLAKQLQQLGWLTSYQSQLLLGGRGAELVLGPYILVDRLGEGGNGQVFKARHQTMQRDVALKMLRRELLTDTEVVGRFHREIEVVSQISHPNIVHAYDAGPVGDNLVLAMEFIDGMDLDRLVRQSGPLAVADAVDAVRQAANGLQHAHERGLVHRDIKPANLLLAQREPRKPARASERSTVQLSNTTSMLPGGLIKILDLGLARLEESPQGSRTAQLTILAGPSLMQGTPDYMAPEQALDFHQADIRSDIYSLGCTFYFLLTGQPPFPAGTLAQKLMNHQQTEPPAVQNVRADVPGALVKVLGKMLAKRPGDRFQTPGAVTEALTELLANGTLGPRSLRTVQVESQLVPGQAAGASRSLVGTASAALRWCWRSARRRPRLALAVLAVGLSLALVFGAIQGLFDGVFDSSEGAALRRVLEPLNQPDCSETQVLKRLGKFIRTYPGMLGPLREELRAVAMRRPGSPQALRAGVWLTYLPSPLDQLDKQQIPINRRFAGAPAELVAVLGEPSASYYRISALAFRPDCKMLAVAGDRAPIMLWDFADGVPRQLPDLRGHKAAVSALAFTPDGRWLVSGGGNNSEAGDNSIRLWDVTQPTIEARAVLAGHTNTVTALAISPDGKWLASGGQDQSIRLWDLARNEGRVLAPRTTFVRSLAFAPDGQTLAVAGSYWRQVRLLDLAGKYVDLKFAVEQHTLKVVFAPDGQTLATHTDNQVVLWDPIKQVERTRLKGHAATVRDLVFLPDSKTLLSGEAPEDNMKNVNEPEGRIIQWALATEGPQASWRLPCGGIKRLALASDGRHLAVGGRNSVVYILRLAPPKISP